ncbi:MAG: sugar phosphorylase [Oscillospiraceae bacterium]|nr:sugar phosphorylase [Oscillospiraceae bacterium]
MDAILEKTQYLFPKEAAEVAERIRSLIKKWKLRIRYSYPALDQRDSVLITYGDSILDGKIPPLAALNRFLEEVAGDCISAIHLLPMFPYTSDDGFSVVNFREVDPALGDWEDIKQLRERYDLMFDCVVNHASGKSRYIEGYKKGEKPYDQFFIRCDPTLDYSMVTRPRTLPLLTGFETARGIEYLWTTFSADQVDFDFRNPDVLLEILDILLMYAERGARFFRFDAACYLWKELGTNCINLPQTHEIIKLIRLVMDECVTGMNIITETNVPHEENITYFGNGHDEAGLVYQFPLPPLVLYSFLKHDTSNLTQWLQNLEPTTSDTAFFNYLASHDGIGLRPVENILPAEEVAWMVDKAKERGARVNYRTTADGSPSPYELNITYLDAVAGDETSAERIARKFLASQCVLLSLAGIPGIYIHSLLGARNDYRAVEESGINRRINRSKLEYKQLLKELEDTDSLRGQILTGYRNMLRVRCTQESFSPRSPQHVMSCDPRLIALKRGEGDHMICVYINVSAETVVLDALPGVDLLSGRSVGKSIRIGPYEYMWIRENKEEFV